MLPLENIFKNRTVLKSNNKKSLIEKVEFILSTKGFMVFLFFGGLVGYFIVQNSLNMAVSASLENNTNAINQVSVTLPSKYKLFLEILKLIFSTAITTGALSLLLRISSMKNNISDIVVDTYNNYRKSVLNFDFELDGYDTSTLENLQRKIVLHISNNKVMDINKLDESVYCLEKNLINLTVNLFWEYHERNTIIIPNKSKGVFTKRISTEYKVINLFGLKNEVKFVLCLPEEINAMCSKPKVIHFQINNEDLSSEIDKYIDIEDVKNSYYNIYPKKFIFRRELQQCKEHIVKIVCEYDVPITDLTHTYKLSKPCQKLNHSIILDGDEISEWDLDVNGFSSWFCDDSELKKNYNVKLPTSKNAVINFNHWTLPGAGYVVILKYNNINLLSKKEDE